MSHGRQCLCVCVYLCEGACVRVCVCACVRACLCVFVYAWVLMHACVSVQACETLLDLMHSLDSDDLLHFQLLDLMHTLHTRAASIFSSWAEEEQRTRSGESVVSGGSCQGSLENIDAGASSLWIKCWCPLLQGERSLTCRYRHVWWHYYGLFMKCCVLLMLWLSISSGFMVNPKPLFLALSSNNYIIWFLLDCFTVS